MPLYLVKEMTDLVGHPARHGDRVLSGLQPRGSLISRGSFFLIRILKNQFIFVRQNEELPKITKTSRSRSVKISDALVIGIYKQKQITHDEKSIVEKHHCIMIFQTKNTGFFRGKFETKV